MSKNPIKNESNYEVDLELESDDSSLFLVWPPEDAYAAMALPSVVGIRSV